MVVARLVFVLRAALDEQKGAFPLKADENKNVFPVAYILPFLHGRGVLCAYRQDNVMFRIRIKTSPR